eukprot:2743301-Rhodomonas_salina.1
MAATTGDNAAAGRWIQIQVASPAGDKHPMKVRTSDDVGTLRAIVTQMWDSGDWTQVNDRREDRKEYSDFLDEDTGFAEVVALQGNPQSQTQSQQLSIPRHTQRQLHAPRHIQRQITAVSDLQGSALSVGCCAGVHGSVQRQATVVVRMAG